MKTTTFSLRGRSRKGSYNILRDDKEVGFCHVDLLTGFSRVWIKKDIPESYFEFNIKSLKDLLEQIVKEMQVRRLYKIIFAEDMECHNLSPDRAKEYGLN